MYKVEYSWYGAVGATFLASVPDLNSAGDARWVRIHSIRCSNQTRLPSLGNAFLPMTYYSSRGSATESQIYKYGASYYIDGGDKGTVAVQSALRDPVSLTDNQDVVLLGLQCKTLINAIRNRQQVYPIRMAFCCNGRVIVRLVKNPTVSSGNPVYTTESTLSPLNVTISNGLAISGGRTIASFQLGSGGDDFDLSPYFGYNKDYLSFPLAATEGDTLWVVARAIGAGLNGACSLTWEEQS